jgi:hypothetical protein
MPRTRRLCCRIQVLNCGLEPHEAECGGVLSHLNEQPHEHFGLVFLMLNTTLGLDEAKSNSCDPEHPCWNLLSFSMAFLGSGNGFFVGMPSKLSAPDL